MSPPITIDTVLHWEQLRRAAMLAGDSAALETLLSPDIVYVHSTGTRDTRSSYLHKIREGTMRYLHLNWSDLQVQLLPDVALVNGRMDATVLKDGQEKPLHSIFLTVWTAQPSDGGSAWRLCAHQGTLLP